MLGAGTTDLAPTEAEMEGDAETIAALREEEKEVIERKGTDAAERSRFGGIGLTVREAEQVLRTRYREYVHDDYLESRAAAGSALGVGNLCWETEWEMPVGWPLALGS